MTEQAPRSTWAPFLNSVGLLNCVMINPPRLCLDFPSRHSSGHVFEGISRDVWLRSPSQDADAAIPRAGSWTESKRESQLYRPLLPASWLWKQCDQFPSSGSCCRAPHSMMGSSSSHPSLNGFCQAFYHNSGTRNRFLPLWACRCAVKHTHASWVHRLRSSPLFNTEHKCHHAGIYEASSI